MSEDPTTSSQGGATILKGNGLSVSVQPSTGEIAVIIERPSASDTRISFSEFVGSPYEARPAAWTVDQDHETGSLCAKWKTIWFEKRVSLVPGEASVKFEFSFYNSGPTMTRPAFGFHLKHSETPAQQGKNAIDNASRLGAGTETRYTRPDRPWLEAKVGAANVCLLFPEGMLDAIAISEKSGSVTLTPLIYHVGLLPGYEVRFTALLYIKTKQYPSEEIGAVWESVSDGLVAEEGRISDERRSRFERMATEEAPVVRDFASVAETNRPLRMKSDALIVGKARRLELLQRWHEGTLSSSELIHSIREA
jgi:hypothetical protein